MNCLRYEYDNKLLQRPRRYCHADDCRGSVGTTKTFLFYRADIIDF